VNKEQVFSIQIQTDGGSVKNMAHIYKMNLSPLETN